MWTLLPNLTFYLIVWGFHRTFATGAACQQRTLTLPDTWSCPSLGLACVLMSRPISPELVLFPDFWVSNILRYFCFDQGTFEIDPREVLWSIWGLHQTLSSPPLRNVTWHSGTWPSTVTPSTDQTLDQFMNLLPNLTLLPILTLLPNFGRFPVNIATDAAS